MLLVFGVWHVTITVATMQTLPATLARLFATQKLGAYTSGDVAAPLGIAAIVVQMLALVLAIGFAVPRIREKRLSWWIPVAAAAVAWAVTMALVLAAVVVDPAFTAHLDSVGS